MIDYLLHTKLSNINKNFTMSKNFPKLETKMRILSLIRTLLILFVSKFRVRPPPISIKGLYKESEEFRVREEDPFSGQNNSSLILSRSVNLTVQLNHLLFTNHFLSSWSFKYLLLTYNPNLWHSTQPSIQNWKLFLLVWKDEVMWAVLL